MSTKIIYCSIPSKTLAVAIASNAYSFKLNDIKKWNGDDLVAGDFGTTAWAVFRNTANTKIEIMRIDPTTIASNSITIVKRGLSPEGGNYDTEVVALMSDWNANETIVELGTNPPQIYNELLRKNDDETITSVITFTDPNIPAMDVYSAPTDDKQLATKKYVDDIASGGTASINRIVVAGTAGETVAAGNLVYWDATDKEWKLCDADTAATVENVLLGIAQGAGTDGNTISGGVLLFGLDSNQTGLTVGVLYYAGNTAGGISSSAGTTEVTVGISKSATTLYFCPRFNQQINEDIQDALGGSDGTPSNSNKYLTQTGFIKATECYAASTTGNDTYVVAISPAPSALVAGMRIRFKPDTANTGACSLQVNDLTAKAIKVNVSDDPPTGTIIANQVVEVVYDGTNFQLISTPNALNAGATSAADNFHKHTTPIAGINGLETGLFDYQIRLTNDNDGGLGTMTLTEVFGITKCIATNTNAYVENNYLIGSQAGYLAMNNAKDIKIQVAVLFNNATGEEGFGLTGLKNYLYDYDYVHSGDGQAFIGFVANNSTLYAKTANSTTETKTEIAGASFSGWHIYTIEWNVGVNVKFYIDGVLVATHTTNLPDNTQTTSLYFGVGMSTNADATWISPVKVSMEL